MIKVTSISLVHKQHLRHLHRKPWESPAKIILSVGFCCCPPPPLISQIWTYLGYNISRRTNWLYSPFRLYWIHLWTTTHPDLRSSKVPSLIRNNHWRSTYFGSYITCYLFPGGEWCLLLRCPETICDVVTNFPIFFLHQRRTSGEKNPEIGQIGERSRVLCGKGSSTMITTLCSNYKISLRFDWNLLPKITEKLTLNIVTSSLL